MELPDYLFERQDASADELFYSVARLVTHIDDATIAALTDYYDEVLQPGDRILDLMSSWISHLPESMNYEQVTGLGMNEEELANNPQLDKSLVHNLNTRPQLPFDDATFDAVLIAVSVQYLTQPLVVFNEIARVLCPRR